MEWVKEHICMIAWEDEWFVYWSLWQLFYTSGMVMDIGCRIYMYLISCVKKIVKSVKWHEICQKFNPQVACSCNIYILFNIFQKNDNVTNKICVMYFQYAFNILAFIPCLLITLTHCKCNWQFWSHWSFFSLFVYLFKFINCILDLFYLKM